MKKSEITEILKFMNALYPNRKLQIDSVTKDVWYNMLCEYSLTDVKDAITRLASSNTYIPNLPEIVKSIQPSLRFEIETLSNNYAIYVRSPNVMYPFKFKDKKMANEFLAKLKNYNLDEDTVRDMYAEHINSNCERIVTTINNVPLNNRFSYK